MSARVLTDKQFLSLAEFRYQVRRFLHFSERECRARGLQTQHYQLLIALLGLPPHKNPTVGTLADTTSLQAAFVVVPVMIVLAAVSSRSCRGC